MKKLNFPNVNPVSSPVYRPWIQGWSVTLDEMRETLEDGTFTLTQLDISISPDRYVQVVNKGCGQEELTQLATDQYSKACPFNCKFCFERRSVVKNPLMNNNEVFDMLKEAKDLGLKNVKFLGPGELIQNKKLFEILDFLKEHNIKIAIFTKGIVLGKDYWANKFHKINALEFCEKLVSYDNVTILLGVTSMNTNLEEEKLAAPLVKNIFQCRNKAIENLVYAGMSNAETERRLAFIMTPLLNDNIDEAMEIYSWALERNIPTILAPTMMSGRGNDMPEVHDEVFKQEKLVQLYIEVYVYLIRKKIMTLKQIKEEGISSYPGYVCNQFAGGMLIRKDGTVQGCPGNDSDEFIYAPDVRKQSLKQIWINSLAYKIRKQLIETGTLTLTQPCYAKSEELKMPDGRILIKRGEGSIPVDFYEKVLDGIQERIKRME